MLVLSFCNQRVYFILRGYISSSFLWFANRRLKSSCLLVSTLRLCHCFWDCHPVLSLTAFWILIDFCHEVALSWSIDAGVIAKPWDCICNGVVYAFDRGSVHQQSRFFFGWSSTSSVPFMIQTCTSHLLPPLLTIALHPPPPLCTLDPLLCMGINKKSNVRVCRLPWGVSSCWPIFVFCPPSGTR